MKVQTFFKNLQSSNVVCQLRCGRLTAEDETILFNKFLLELAQAYSLSLHFSKSKY